MNVTDSLTDWDFPSFSEGLSLRVPAGTLRDVPGKNFPSFSEGLSLRVLTWHSGLWALAIISLPFRRDFH